MICLLVLAFRLKRSSDSPCKSKDSTARCSMASQCVSPDHTPSFRIFADRLHRRQLRNCRIRVETCLQCSSILSRSEVQIVFKSRAVAAEPARALVYSISPSNLVHTFLAENPLQHPRISDKLLNPIAQPPSESHPHCDRLREK